MFGWYHRQHNRANLFLCRFLVGCVMMERNTTDSCLRLQTTEPMATALPSNGILTFLTDFSSADGYVGAMKGVALSESTELTLVDIGHEIPAFDIRRAAYTLRMAVPEFPSGTTHVAVIDPGVGTSRKVLVAHVRDQFVVGPDNGLISLLLDWAPDAQVFAVESKHLPDTIRSATFHGRDIFTPIAAKIACGRLDVPGDLKVLPKPIVFDTSFQREKQTITGTVLCADRFGNLITSIPFEELQSAGLSTVHIGQTEITRFVETYGNAEPGAVVALKGSLGLLEISVINGDAAKRLSVTNGTTVRIRL